MGRASVLLAVSCLLTLAVLTPARAAGLTPPVADCNLHGTLTHSYSAAQLQNGLATMPVDIKEYSACYNVLQQALLAKIGKLPGGPGGAGGGGSFLPVWLIVLLALLVAGGAGFAALGLRNRGQTD